MDKRELLIKRLEEIGLSLKKNNEVLALIGLGSSGLERERLDEFSDLDFFVIVKEGYAQQYIHNLDWLSTVSPIGFHFQNADVGHKLLFADGVFCEFAVFEPNELKNIPLYMGKIIWKSEDFDEITCILDEKWKPQEDREVEWLLGEALTNIYIGLQRFGGGEKYTAFEFVQVYATTKMVDLISRMEEEHHSFKDPYNKGRRLEKRYPTLTQEFPKFIQGYDKTPESAKAILDFLDHHFEVNKCMKENIELYL
jgi:lincosamide nucleotidyltransferase B/F